MLRICETEILEQSDVPLELVARAYRDIARIHRCLGDTRLIVRAIRHDPLPVRRVLDVGCATGLVLHEAAAQARCGSDWRGAPSSLLRSPRRFTSSLQADASTRPTAVCRCRILHAPGTSSSRSGVDSFDTQRRKIAIAGGSSLLDLIRHPLPLALFRIFVAPVICPIDAEDGQRSIRRSRTLRWMNF